MYLILTRLQKSKLQLFGHLHDFLLLQTLALIPTRDPNFKENPWQSSKFFPSSMFTVQSLWFLFRMNPPSMSTPAKVASENVSSSTSTLSIDPIPSVLHIKTWDECSPSRRTRGSVQRWVLPAVVRQALPGFQVSQTHPPTQVQPPPSLKPPSCQPPQSPPTSSYRTGPLSESSDQLRVGGLAARAQPVSMCAAQVQFLGRPHKKGREG